MLIHRQPTNGMPDLELRLKCREVLIEVAQAHHVAPCLVLAHVVEPPSANVARIEVQRRMFSEFGIRRRWIALMFRRDLRRMRRSVIGV